MKKISAQYLPAALAVLAVMTSTGCYSGNYHPFMAGRGSQIDVNLPNEIGNPTRNGWKLLYLEQPTDAIEHFNLGIADERQRPYALWGLCCAYGRMGELDKAIQYSLEAAAAAPTVMPIVMQVGQAYTEKINRLESTGETKRVPELEREAIIYFKKAQVLEPGHSRIYDYLIPLLLRQQQYAEALSLANEAKQAGANISEERMAKLKTLIESKSKSPVPPQN